MVEASKSEGAVEADRRASTFTDELEVHTGMQGVPARVPVLQGRNPTSPNSIIRPGRQIFFDTSHFHADDAERIGRKRGFDPETPFMRVLFATTLFLSASLLFFVQPMVARMVLPTFGGSSAVWTTCMVFFQTLLLAGYSYAHASATRLSPLSQAVLQLGLLVVPLVFLPVAVSKDWAPPGDARPFSGCWPGWPSPSGFFLAVSASGPLLQKWFAGSGAPESRDPYFLYAASNVGSMAGLLGYPTLVEPNLA